MWVKFISKFYQRQFLSLTHTLTLRIIVNFIFYFYNYRTILIFLSSTNNLSTVFIYRLIIFSSYSISTKTTFNFFLSIAILHHTFVFFHTKSLINFLFIVLFSQINEQKYIQLTNILCFCTVFIFA
jgi:hypothetical protein